MKKNQTADFFEVTIKNDPVVTYKNKKRGRTAKDQKPEKTAVTTGHFSIDVTFDEAIFKKAIERCGYYPLITNKAEKDLSIEAAMMAHKNQYKSEHTNRRAKSAYNLEPIYLQTPERIQAMLFLFKTALQVIVLIERAARKNIDNRDKGLDNFMPNRKDVRNPKTEYLLAEFQDIVKGEMALPDGKAYGFVSELTDLQKDILSLLEVPDHAYSYEYLFNTR